MELNQYPLWTALVTPFTAEGDVDYPSLKTLLWEQDAAKNGILLLGSTGEALSLSLNEKKNILDYAINEKLTSPLMVGVGGIGASETEEWVKYLNGINVDCYLLVTPLYAKPGRIGQKEWFKNLLDTATRPCMLYNIPGRTGVKMNFEAIADLKDHPQFWAIKEASGSVADFKKYRMAAPQARIYSGDDGLLPDFCDHGCVGLVSVISNVWPSQAHRYVELCLEGKQTAVTPVWPEVAETLFEAPNPIPAKAILHELGKISSPRLRAPLTDLDLATRENLKKSHARVLEWAQKGNQ